MKAMNRSMLGFVNPFAVTTAVLAILLIGLGGFSVWAYANYADQKDHVDAKIATAVTGAKKEQKAEDDKVFAEQEKQPTREFVGPDDLGRVTFSYPKTWSVYISQNGGKGIYEAYLDPLAVTAGDGAVATHVIINGTKYEDVLRSFQDRVNKGNLTATAITYNGATGMRLDGAFSNTVQGSLAVFKVRDKTLQIDCTVPANIPDFNTIVLPSVKFNS